LDPVSKFGACDTVPVAVIGVCGPGRESIFRVSDLRFERKKGFSVCVTVT